MSLGVLRTLIRPFRATGSRIFQHGRNVRSYSITVSNIAPTSGYHGTLRCYSDKCAKNKFDPSRIDPSLMASYDEIVALPQHPEVLLIDVRGPNELASTGTIPTSINIPLKVVGEELKLSPKEFESKYGRTKPDQNSPIIFCCRIGVRSGEAANIAEKLGFTNAKNYVGSWLEYAEKNGLPL